MKYSIVFCYIVLSVLLVFNSFGHKNDFPVLKGPYLGQKPPSMIPEIFASGIISKEAFEGDARFSEDGLKMCFYVWDKSDSTEKIYFTEQKKNRWAEPFPIPLSGNYSDIEPSMTKDGKRIYFASNRSKGKSARKDDFDIWYINRKGDSWSDPVNLGEPVNNSWHQSHPMITADDTIYFASVYQGKRVIMCSRLENNGYVSPKVLDFKMNPNYASGPFVSMDGSFLIFHSNKDGGYGSYDLFISFKHKDGTWMRPMNMGKNINSPGMDGGAFVTIDGKYLFFSSDRRVKDQSDVYWVDARIIEELKPKYIK